MYLKQRYNKAFTSFIIFQFIVVMLFIYFPMNLQVNEFRSFYLNTQRTIFQTILDKKESDLMNEVVTNAVSDDLYNHIEQPNEEWFKEHFTDLANSAFGFDSIIVVDEEQDLIYAQTDHFVISQDFLKSNLIRQAIHNLEYNVGYIRYKNHFYLIGVSQIVTSTRRFTPNGALILVQPFDLNFIEQKVMTFMDQDIGLEISLHSNPEHSKYETVSPIQTPDNKVIGNVILKLNHPFFKTLKSLFSQNVLISFALLFGFFAFISMFVSQKLTQRIELLYREVTVAVKRNFNYEIQISGDDEISHLAESFNSMSKTMREHVEQIYETNEKLQNTFFEIIQGLITAIEVKDRYTRGHSYRVMVYSEMIAKYIPSADSETVRMAALLHDVGKIGVPENILNKKDRLTDEEYEIVKAHPDYGYKILSNIEGFNQVKDIIRFHHERIDGRGYPCGMKDLIIPIESRIIAVADTFDAITSDRAYRKGKSVPEALQELLRVKGTQLDPRIVDVFIKVAEENDYFKDIIENHKSTGTEAEELFEENLFNIAT